MKEVSYEDRTHRDSREGSSSSVDVNRRRVEEKTSQGDQSTSAQTSRKTVKEATRAKALKMTESWQTQVSPQDRELAHHLGVEDSPPGKEEAAEKATKYFPSIEESVRLEREIVSGEAAVVSMRPLSSIRDNNIGHIVETNLREHVAALKVVRQEQEAMLPKSHGEVLKKEIDEVSAANRARSEKQEEEHADMWNNVMNRLERS